MKKPNQPKTGEIVRFVDTGFAPIRKTAELVIGGPPKISLAELYESTHIPDLERSVKQAVEPLDIVSDTTRRFGVSRSEAARRLARLRVAIHEFLLAQDVKSVHDPGLASDLRQLIESLNASDDVLLEIPEQWVESLRLFQAPKAG